MDLISILADALKQEASDVFIVAGLPISFKVHGTIINQNTDTLTPTATLEVISKMYELAGNRDISRVIDSGDDDFSFSVRDLSRFRVNTYKQRGSIAAVIRIITFELPNYKEIGIPESIMSIANKTNGFVLVTGPAASGKSTTLSCIINAVNQSRNCHIITLEDPIEYLHRHSKSVVSQREISMDTNNYVVALRAALRQSPDVILLGEMRDYETIKTAVTAAETGHFMISTLHTVGAANTIDRIIDAFPVDQQHQIRVQLSMVLDAVISQMLVPSIDGKIVPAFEIMFVNSAIRNMIREAKVHQIDSIIFSSGDEKMVSMDNSLVNLYKEGKISFETAIHYSANPKQQQKKLELLK